LRGWIEKEEGLEEKERKGAGGEERMLIQPRRFSLESPPRELVGFSERGRARRNQPWNLGRGKKHDRRKQTVVVARCSNVVVYINIEKKKESQSLPWYIYPRRPSPKH